MPKDDDPQERTRDPPKAPRKKPGERAPVSPAVRKLRAPSLETRCPKCQRKLKLRGIGVERCYSGECGHCRVEIEAVAHELPGGEPVFETYPMPGGPKKKGASSDGDGDGEFPPDDYHLYFPFDGPNSEGREPKKKGKRHGK